MLPCPLEETVRRTKALIITGYGLNCESETAYTLRLAGAEPSLVHLNDLIDGKMNLGEFRLLVLIGGFSFGDHISAGKVFANRLRRRLGDALREFIEGDNLVMGICNGFQTMVKLGILPGFDRDYRTQRVTLLANDSGVFRNAWVTLKGEKDSACLFTRGIDRLELPVRHGEGKFYIRDPEVLERLRAGGQIALRYARPDSGEPTMEFPYNPNGSLDAIAGISDPTGRIFGMMPHPEAYHSPLNHPHWIRQKMEGKLPREGGGLRIFKNAVAYLESGLPSPKE